MEGDNSDIRITAEEFDKISNAMKNKEFRDLFFEYAKELEDPEKKKLYEKEIIALEKQRGSDVKFVKPKPGYVIKTVETKENKKVFINICSCDLVEKASSTLATENNKRGQYWSIPHIIIPPRDDVDKGGQKCITYDVAFHEETLSTAFKDPKFKNLVNNIAVQDIEKQNNITLDKNNLKFPKMKYKGTPCSSVIRNKQENTLERAEIDIGGIKIPYPPMQQKTIEKPCQTGRKTETVQTQNVCPSKTVPKYRLVHRGHFDMQAYTTERDSRYSTRPQELAIEIELPLAKSSASLDLDVFERQLILSSDKPGYHLDIQLPFPVKDEEGKASFDKAKKILTVVLPVVQPDLPQVIDEKSKAVIISSNATSDKETQKKGPMEENKNHGSTDIIAENSKTAVNCKAASCVSEVKDSERVTEDRSGGKHAGVWESSAIERSGDMEGTFNGTSDRDAVRTDNCTPEQASKLPQWKVKQREYELAKLGKDFSCSLSADAISDLGSSEDVSNVQIPEKEGQDEAVTYVSEDGVEHMDDLPGMFKLPPFVCDQDAQRIYVRLLVSGVVLKDVSLGITDNKVSVSFPSDTANPLAADWCLLLQTVNGEKIDADQSTFDISGEEVLLTLRKAPNSEGEWDHVMAGSAQRNLKDIYFSADIGKTSVLEGVKLGDRWCLPDPELNAPDDNCVPDIKEKFEEKLESLLNEQENSLWKWYTQEENKNKEHDPLFFIGDQQVPEPLQDSVQKDPGVNNEVLKRQNHCPIEHRTSWSQGSSDDIPINLHLEELEDDVVLDDISPRDILDEEYMRPVARSQSYDCTCPRGDVKIKPILKRCKSLTYEDVGYSFSSNYSSADSISEDEPHGRRRNKSVSFDMKPKVHEFTQLSRNQWRKQRKAQRKQEALCQMLKEEKEKHDKLKKDLQENSNKEDEAKATEAKVVESTEKSTEKPTPISMSEEKEAVCEPGVNTNAPPSSTVVNSKNAKKKNKKKRRRSRGSQSSNDEEDSRMDKNAEVEKEDKTLPHISACVTAKEVLTNSLIFELEG